MLRAERLDREDQLVGAGNYGGGGKELATERTNKASSNMNAIW